MSSRRVAGDLTVGDALDFDGAVPLLRARPAWVTDPFRTVPWLAAAAAVLEADAEVVVHRIERDGELVALAPIVTDRSGTSRFLGDPLADISGPIHRPIDGAAVADALPRLLAELLPAGTSLHTRGLPVDLARTLPSGAVVVTLASPVIDIDRGWDDYLAGPAARRRRRIASQADALLRSPDVEVRDVGGAAIGAAFDLLVGLHEARFGGTSVAFAGARRAFVREAVTGLAVQGAASIRVLDIDDRPAAAVLVLHHGGDDWFYQSGSDPRHAGRSVGRALLADTVRRAFDRPGRRFRLLRGAEPYKTWWATSDQPVAVVAVRGQGSSTSEETSQETS